MLLCCLAAACGPGAAGPTSSPSASGPASPTRPTGYRVLYTATTQTSNDVFLYDSASSAPQKLASLPMGQAPEAHFVSAQKIAYVDSDGTSARIMTFDLSTRATTADATTSGFVPAFAYSHDGSMLAYLLHDTAGRPSLHVRRGGQQTSLKLNPIPGRGVGREDELRLEYSPGDQDPFVGGPLVGKHGRR